MGQSAYMRITSTAGVWSVAATCFAIPLSTSLMSVCSVLVFFFWLISGRFTRFPRLISANPVALLATVLFAILALGVLRSPAELNYSIDILGKYRELLFIPIVIALLSGFSRSPKLCEDAFVTGCIVLLSISFALYFSLIPPMKFGYSVLHHITHSFFMALLGFFALHRTLDSKQYRYFWLLIFFATVINIVFIAPGRAGMVTFALLMVLTLVQRLSFSRLVIGLLLALGVMAGAYFGSDNVSTRTNEAIWEIKNYAPGKSRTSLGMRFDWWQNSVDLIKQKPILGHGTGSFATVQKEIKEKKTRKSDNPHNEFLFIGVQAGLLGLGLFLLLLTSQIVLSFKMKPERRYLIQGVVLAMAAGCIANSFLFDSHQGHFYAFMSALYFIPTNGNTKITT